MKPAHMVKAVEQTAIRGTRGISISLLPVSTLPFFPKGPFWVYTLVLLYLRSRDVSKHHATKIPDCSSVWSLGSFMLLYLCPACCVAGTVQGLETSMAQDVHGP